MEIFSNLYSLIGCERLRRMLACTFDSCQTKWIDNFSWYVCFYKASNSIQIRSIYSTGVVKSFIEQNRLQLCSLLWSLCDCSTFDWYCEPKGKKMQNTKQYYARQNPFHSVLMLPYTKKKQIIIPSIRQNFINFIGIILFKPIYVYVYTNSIKRCWW